jgi:hypothetical protein
VLLTRAPLYRGRSPFSHDLHVLGAPLTFVLSQDQTLQFESFGKRSGLNPDAAILLAIAPATLGGRERRCINPRDFSRAIRPREASRFRLFSVSGSRNLVSVAFVVKGFWDFFFGSESRPEGADAAVGRLSSAEGADTWIARENSARDFCGLLKSPCQFSRLQKTIGRVARGAR